MLLPGCSGPISVDGGCAFVGAGAFATGGPGSAISAAGEGQERGEQHGNEDLWPRLPPTRRLAHLLPFVDLCPVVLGSSYESNRRHAHAARRGADRALSGDSPRGGAQGGPAADRD